MGSKHGKRHQNSAVVSETSACLYLAPGGWAGFEGVLASGLLLRYNAMYQQSLPHAVLENEKAKIYWNMLFILEKPPGNGANKPDMIVHDKETNIWTLFDSIVCQKDKIVRVT